MVSVDLSIVLQIINFIILILVLNIFVYKPLRSILSQRKEKIDGFEHDIETSITSAEEKEQSFSQGIKDARAKGLKHKETFLEEAAQEEKRMIDEIHQKAQTELSQIRDSISRDVESVRSALQNEIDDFAEAIGRKVMGRAL